MEYIYAYIIFSYILMGIVFGVRIYKAPSAKVSDWILIIIIYMLSPLTIIFFILSLDDDIRLK